MPVTAADVMTREVITVTPATPIAEFARLCAEDRISGAPVVSVEGRLVGVVSKTDLIPRLLEGTLRTGGRGDLRALFNIEDDEFGAMPGAAEEGEEDLGAVEEIMQAEVVTVAPGESVEAIARRMAKERIHRVLVVREGRILGIITSLDLLGHFPRAAAGKPAKEAGRKPPKPGKGRAQPAAKRRRA
jgi:CBS domain-containing protein